MQRALQFNNAQLEFSVNLNTKFMDTIWCVHVTGVKRDSPLVKSARGLQDSHSSQPIERAD